MKLTGFMAFTLLSISILSYGVGDVAFATSDPNPALPVSTDIEIVSNGASVTISGSIKDYESSSGYGLTLVILSPDNNIVGIDQITINSDGSFEEKYVAGGPLWKNNGDYVYELKYGPDTSKVSVNYVDGEQVIITQPEPPVITQPEPPVITQPEPPVITQPEPPVITQPEPPVITQPEPPVITQPEPPVITQPEPPVITQPEPPVITQPSVPEPTEPEPVICGAGTEPDANGICIVSQPQCPDGYTMKDGLCVEDGGCLIATAAYGTELAPQVQLLREIRDNTLFSTTSGTSFMSGFNAVYYSFAPTVADWERESPMFKEVVKTMITPMLSTLSIMSLADEGSEVEVLGLGISVIALNLGMYIAAPALVGFKVNQIIKSRK